MVSARVDPHARNAHAGAHPAPAADPPSAATTPDPPRPAAIADHNAATARLRPAVSTNFETQPLAPVEAPPGIAPDEPGPPRVCPKCGAEYPTTHRFCGECGYRIEAPPEPAVNKTQFFGAAMQESWRARLVLIKGESADGVSYHLAGAEHLVGRSDGAILFPEDHLLSPTHCNFFYRGHQLIIRDEGSANGVFVRIKAPMAIEPRQVFLVGEQLLMVEVPQDPPVAPDHEGTWYYGSPRRPSKMHLVQLLAGGQRGMVVRATSDTLSIGREGNHINFPEDPFISGHHAQLSALDDGRLVLTDVGSKNGTFLRLLGETRLEHGDFVFIGQQLLRVEVV